MGHKMEQYVEVSIGEGKRLALACQAPPLRVEREAVERKTQTGGHAAL
jgi:hypothetical protein